MIYILGIALIYAIKYCCDNVECIANKGKQFAGALFVYASFSVLFFISALRGYGVGIDTQHYVDKFLLIQNYSFGEILSSLYTERVEFGYALLNKILGCIFGTPRAIIVANSAIVCYGMAKYTYRYSNASHIAVILFVCSGVFLHSLNITRQIMACVMMINAWGALTYKQYWKSALWYLAGVSFHVTSIVFAVVYFYYLFRENKKLVFITFSISMLLAMFYRPILALISHFVTSIGYLDNAKDKVSAGGIWLVWMIELLLSAFFIASYYLDKKTWSKININIRIIDSASLICVPIFVVYYIVFTYIGTQFNYMDRFGLYFMLFTIPLFINFGKVADKNWGKYSIIYWVGLQICFIGYFALSIQATQYQYVFGW